MFDDLHKDTAEVKHRRRHHRISRPRKDNIKAFRAFLIAYKVDMDNGRKINVKRLQNQFHVGHFPKKYIPVEELRKGSLDDIDEPFATVCYRKIQIYNKREDKPVSSNAGQRRETGSVSRESAVQLIDAAISDLQNLRTRISNLL